MKKIEAIIRPQCLSAVRTALEELGYPGMTLSEVRGYGRQAGQTRQWRGKEYEVDFQRKLKIEIVVINEDVARMVNAIVRVARTGETGDGKIFVIPVSSAVRIRTGDQDYNAI